MIKDIFKIYLCYLNYSRNDVKAATKSTQHFMICSIFHTCLLNLLYLFDNF